MPVSFPSTPATNDEYTFGTTTWVFNGVGWEVVPVVSSGPNTFQSAVKQAWYETLVTTAPNPVQNMTGVLLQYV